MVIQRTVIFSKLLGAFLILFASIFLLSSVADAQQTNKSVEETTLSLNQIRSNLDDVNAKRAKVLEELKVDHDPEHRESLEITLTQLDQQKRNFEKMFEKTALGGLEVELYDVSDNEEEEILHYDWQKELIKIVQPVFNSLQNLTESQRKRDFIRTTRSELQQNLLSINDALLHLDDINESELSTPSINQLNKIKNSWEIKRAYYANQLELINLQYKELEKEGTFFKRLTHGTWDFISNEGKTLFISLGLFFGLLYFFSWILRQVVQRHERKLQAGGHIHSTRLAWRLMLLLYELFSFIIAFTALLVVLHSSGDMVLFGFAILIILAMLISFRNSIPAYFKRLRTFLNMGLAREGERVIYDGIPWEIEHINLYSVFLINPLLDNGRIRLNIDCLENMISRDVDNDEALYPTEAGDTVIIDGVYATITRQTPETVFLDNYGAAIKYGTAEFAGKHFKNISNGYTQSTQFTLSHDHKTDDVELIIAQLKETIAEEVAKNSELESLVEAINANYREVNSYGDLVFGMSIRVGKNAESFYNSVPRLLQRSALLASNIYGWEIPKKVMYS